MTTQRQRAWREKFARIYGGGRKRARSRTRTRGVSMTRRRRSSRRGGGGFGMGKLFSTKNLMFTIGAAILGPKLLGVDSKLAGAAGGFLGAGPIGAVAGYLAAPMVSNVLGGVVNGGSDLVSGGQDI